MSEEIKQEQDGLDETVQDAEAQPETHKKEDKKSKKNKKTVTFTVEEAERMEQLAKDYESLKDQRLRLAAEYDNYRKRTAKEKEQIYSDAKMATVKEFLAVYDNLERAVAQEGDEDSPHKKGMEMIFHQFDEILQKMGVEKIDAVGQPFDPEKHSAVMHIEDETLGENTVAEVFQQGFMLNGKVLRFAVVKVAN